MRQAGSQAGKERGSKEERVLGMGEARIDGRMER